MTPGERSRTQGKENTDTGSDPRMEGGAPKRARVGAAQAEAAVWSPQEQLGRRSLG